MTERGTHFGGGGEGGGGRKDTVKQDAGMLDLTVFIPPPTHTAEAILDLGQASASLPVPVFFHERSLLYDPVFALFSICVRKCLLV